MSNNLQFRLIGYHTKIEKNNNIRLYIFYLAIAALFFNICICIGAEHGEINDTISQTIYLVIFSLVQMGSLVGEIILARKIGYYEYKIYNIESEDLERKKRVADMKNEVLPEYVANKRINPPQAMQVSFKKYIIVFLINIVICVIWFNKIR